MKRQEKGSIIVIVALLATGLAIMSGLAADMGNILYHRTRMQNATDAAALAGARALSVSSAEAIAQAKNLAKSNGFVIQDANVTLPTASQVRVKMSQPVGLWLGQLLSRANVNVGATSCAQMQSRVRYGVRPFGLPSQPFTTGQAYIIKQAAGGSVAGNFAGLALDGTGGSIYQNDLVNGDQQGVTLGQVVSTQPGNMKGPTVSGINQILSGDSTTYANAVLNPNTTERVVTVALVTPLSWSLVTGSSTLVVSGFAQFYLNSVDNQGAITAQYIRTLPSGTPMLPTATLYAARLVQ